MQRPSLTGTGNSHTPTTLTLPAAAAQTAAAAAGASTSTAGTDQAADSRNVRRRLTSSSEPDTTNSDRIIFVGNASTLTVDPSTLPDAPSTSTGTTASNVRLRRPTALAARPPLQQLSRPDTTTDESGDTSLRPTTAAIAALPTLFPQRANLLAQQLQQLQLQQLQQLPEE